MLEQNKSAVCSFFITAAKVFVFFVALCCSVNNTMVNRDKIYIYFFVTSVAHFFFCVYPNRKAEEMMQLLKKGGKSIEKN